MTPGPDLLSIGGVAVHFQRSVDQCRLALAAADIRPTMTLNGVPYFDRIQVARVGAALSASMIGTDATSRDERMTRKPARKQWIFTRR